MFDYACILKYNSKHFIPKAVRLRIWVSTLMLISQWFDGTDCEHGTQGKHVYSRISIKFTDLFIHILYNIPT